MLMSTASAILPIPAHFFALALGQHSRQSQVVSLDDD
jgi:hypothetical protein